MFEVDMKSTKKQITKNKQSTDGSFPATAGRLTMTGKFKFQERMQERDTCFEQGAMSDICCCYIFTSRLSILNQRLKPDHPVLPVKAR